MEELGSLWNYQEDVDELKQTLLCKTIELETLKVEASEEMRKYKEDVKQLINLIQMAYKERDEAKDQFQNLLNKIISSNCDDFNPTIIPIKANSSITESDSLSDQYNQRSLGSSSHVDSFFEAVTSPDFSSINVADSSCINFSSKTYSQDYKCNGSISTGLVSAFRIDPGDAAIESLVKGKILPEKGKLLQAVTEAGPLLQTLIVAGPLPRWKNPPPALKSFRIPPVSSVKACEITNIRTQQPAAAISDSGARKSANLPSSCPDMSRGSSQMCSASMLNFTSGVSSSALGNGWSLNSSCISQIPSGKRQRFL